MELKKLVKDIVIDATTLPSLDVKDICSHSSNVTDGSLFVAIYGEEADGHDFIPQAIENGAAVVITNGREMGQLSVPNIQVANPRLAASRVSAEYYSHPTKKLTVIGITGTNGKTTTASILQKILCAAGIQSAQLGTLGIIAEGFTPEKSLTTPDSITLQKIFRELVNKGFTHVVMEVSSHALDQLRVADVEFNLGVFTNLSPEHLDYHKTMDEYFHAKAKLFKSLPITGTAIINHDDGAGKAMANESQAPVVSISKNGSTDIHYSELTQDLGGIRGAIQAGNLKISISSPLVGNFNVENIICAVSAAISLGINPKLIEVGVSDCKTIPGRMEVISLQNEATVIVDYAHTPDAYEKVLITIASMKNSNGRINILFGCGGDRDATKRPEMGRIAEKYGDQLYITPDNPRTEDLVDINAQICDGLSENKYQIYEDRAIGLTEAILELKAGDILVVLGKGRENYQEVMGEKLPYSDLEIIESFINAD